jgi:hypothetical protein
MQRRQGFVPNAQHGDIRVRPGLARQRVLQIDDAVLAHQNAGTGRAIGTCVIQQFEISHACFP